MLKNRFNKVAVTVIAVSLAILAFSAALDMFSAPAQAQRSYNLVVTEGAAMDVLLIRDIPIKDVENIHILGDQKTFVVQKPDGFAVYRVQPIDRNSK